MVERDELEKELLLLGLLEKAREICCELGDSAALSYLKSSYRLLSKVYHPDLNPRHTETAKKIQQRLNRVRQLLERMGDEQILSLIRKKIRKEDTSKKKILVVEDEFGLQEIFRDVFLMEGYDVRVAVDGDNGYEAYRKFQPDLVFTDGLCPRWAGLNSFGKSGKPTPGSNGCPSSIPSTDNDF